MAKGFDLGLKLDLLNTSSILKVKEEESSEEKVEKNKAETGEKKKEVSPKKELFVDDFEEKADIPKIVDIKVVKELQEALEKKGSDLEYVKKNMNDKLPALDEVIQNGNPNEKKEAIQLKSKIDEFLDLTDEISEDIQQIQGEENKQKDEVTVKNEEKIQATYDNNSVEHKETPLAAKGDDSLLVEVVEKLERVIELGEKILEKLDKLLVSNDNIISVTQNTTMSPNQ